MKYLMSLLLLITVNSAWSFEGGVSGGGGNTLSPRAPSYPVDPETAEHMIYNARGVLKNYLTLKKQAYLVGALPIEQMAAFAPVFSAKARVEDTIEKAHLHVSDRHACKDENNNPVDGSTITPTPNSICISAYNISRKVDVSDITPQSAALMLHEYGELVGLSEDQAVKVQSAALSELRGM
ncbi:MAG: hypothetical protein JSU04_12280 [Bdellovibrionales bacterium]|nr:hypothetical protein [Bdellovibrionales bacterium]